MLDNNLVDNDLHYIRRGKGRGKKRRKEEGRGKEREEGMSTKEGKKMEEETVVDNRLSDRYMCTMHPCTCIYLYMYLTSVQQ